MTILVKQIATDGRESILSLKVGWHDIGKLDLLLFFLSKLGSFPQSNSSLMDRNFVDWTGFSSDAVWPEGQIIWNYLAIYKNENLPNSITVLPK